MDLDRFLRLVLPFLVLPFLVLPFLVLLAATPVAAETVVIGGTGSSGPFMQLLAEEFRRDHPQFEVRIVSPPLGSGGALRALAAGRIDLAVTGRRLGPDDPVAGFIAIELARTPFVMATQNGSRPAGFSLAELAEIYAGNLSTWNDGQPIRLILRAPQESDTLTLRAMSPAMDASVQAAARRAGMVTAENDLEAVELLDRIPGSLAPTTLGLLRTLGRSYRLLPLAGASPSLRALEAGTYPWSKGLFAVHGPKASTATRAFVAFLRGPRAQQTMRHADYLPAPVER